MNVSATGASGAHALIDNLRLVGEHLEIAALKAKGSMIFPGPRQLEVGGASKQSRVAVEGLEGIEALAVQHAGGDGARLVALAREQTQAGRELLDKSRSSPNIFSDGDVLVDDTVAARGGEWFRAAQGTVEELTDRVANGSGDDVAAFMRDFGDRL